MSSFLRQIVRENLLLTAVVVTFTATTVLPLLNFIYSHIRSSNLPRYRHKAQSWALVTGASDGIGYGFVTELADQGFNVILHGRNKSKLDGLVVKLKQTYPVRQFRTLVVDASDRSVWHRLDEFASTLLEEKLEVTVLINNVGGGVGQYVFVPLQERTQKDINTFLDMNAAFPAQITRSLIPVLKANQPSLVMNISSLASMFTLPYLDVYCGAKAFDNAWSQSLRVGMMAQGDDIEVLAILVGKVQTAGTKMIDTSFFIPSSRQLAQSALQKVGCGSGITTAYWPHAIQVWMMTVVPTRLKEKIFVNMSKEEMSLERKAS